MSRAQQTDPVYDAKELPDVSFVDAHGNEMRLKQYRGRVVLLNFWATWCAPCIREMPDLDRLQAEIGEGNLKIIALSEDGKFPAVEEFYERHNITNLEIFHDVGSKVFFSLGLSSLPHSIIIDKKGREAARFDGYVDWSAGARLIIDKLIAEQ